MPANLYDMTNRGAKSYPMDQPMPVTPQISPGAAIDPQALAQMLMQQGQGGPPPGAAPPGMMPPDAGMPPPGMAPAGGPPPGAVPMPPQPAPPMPQAAPQGPVPLYGGQGAPMGPPGMRRF